MRWPARCGAARDAGSRKSYREGCEYMQRVHVCPLLGARRASEVDRGDVEAFGRRLLKAGMAPKTVRNILRFLHAVFEHGSMLAGA